MLTHLLVYGGWPNVFSAVPVAKDVFDKGPQQTDAQSKEDNANGHGTQQFTTVGLRFDTTRSAETHGGYRWRAGHINMLASRRDGARCQHCGAARCQSGARSNQSCPARERSRAPADARSTHHAARRAARAPATYRFKKRLWPRPVRRLHGPYGWQTG